MCVDVKTTANNLNDNSIQVRSAEVAPDKYGLYSPLPSNFHKIKMDYNQFLHKPLFVDQVTWTTASPVDTNLGNVVIPGEILATNDFLTVPFSTSCFYRMKAKVIFQVAGTIRHSGIILAAALPAGAAVSAPANYLLSVPHGFLYANQANPVSIEVPFYNTGPLRQTNLNSRTARLRRSADSNDSYAAVVLRVINQLSAPTTGSTSVIITAHVVIEELEFYTPAPIDIVYAQSQIITQALDSATSILKQKSSDFLDLCRGTLHAWTGLHNPNLGAPVDKHYMQQRNNPNVVDALTHYETLSPYSMDESAQTLAPFFHNKEDEMDMQYLLSQPQFVARNITIPLNSAVGSQVFARPITPFMAVPSTTTASHVLTSIQSKLAFCASHWSGDMELMLQIDMSNMQYLKLLVVLDYTRNVNSTNLGINGSPTDFRDFQGTLTHTLEFAGGGTIQCVKLPFMSAFRQLPLSTDWRANALSHGMVRIYVLQPPVTSDDTIVPELNVLMRCLPNFQLYGMSHRRATYTTVPAPASFQGEEEKDADTMEVQSMEMSEVSTVTSQECTDHKKETDPGVIYTPGNLRPIVSVRDIVRRMYPIAGWRLSPSETSRNNFIIIPVEGLFRTSRGGNNFPGTGSNVTPLQIVSDLFYGFRGSIKTKIMITGSNATTVQYFPPGLSALNEGGVALYTPLTFSTTNVPFQNDAIEVCLPYPDPGRPVPVVTLQEMADYNRRPSILRTPTGPGAIEDQVTIHDCIIPYMSHQDFTTRESREILSPVTVGSTESLGYIKVSFTSTVTSVTPLLYSSVYVTVFAGCGDDARFGMLAAARECSPYFLTDGTSYIQGDPILPLALIVGNNTVPVRPAVSGATPSYVG